MIHSSEQRMLKAVEAIKKEFSAVRTGRANPGLVEGVRVEYYGTEVPLKQLASIAVPESKLIVIHPFDKTVAPNIEKAIQKSDLGLTPKTEAGVIRLQIPDLTEERRRELSKVVKASAEKGKVALRNIRRDEVEAVKKKGLPEDASKREQEIIQKITDRFTSEIENLTAAKEKELMSL